MHGFQAPADRINFITDPPGGRLSFNAPLSNGRFRSYFAWFDAGNRDGHRRITGPRSLKDFAAGSIVAGAPSDWFAPAELIGPLASFEGTDHWVPHPYHNGVALIGDAAACSDLSFGAGLALALGDVRSIRNRLLANGNWDVEGQESAAEHDRRYGAVHRITNWIRTLSLDPRPQAAALRARALPRIAAEPGRRVDYVGRGPSAPSNDAPRHRFFGEDSGVTPARTRNKWFLAGYPPPPCLRQHDSLGWPEVDTTARCLVGWWAVPSAAPITPPSMAFSA